MSKYINRFTTIPKELFRLNNGPAISLRDRTLKKTGSYDLLTEAGKVKPKAVTNPDTYESKTETCWRLSHVFDTWVEDLVIEVKVVSNFDQPLGCCRSHPPLKSAFF
jgi:hypothetical protein